MTKVYRQQKLADNNEGLLITKDNRQQRIADRFFLKDNKGLMITKNEGLMVTKNNRQQWRTNNKIDKQTTTKQPNDMVEQTNEKTTDDGADKIYI